MKTSRMKSIFFLLCLSITSCFLERWERTEVVNAELNGKNDAEMLKHRALWDNFFIDDILLAVRIHPKEFSPYSSPKEFICSLYTSSLDKNKSVFIDEILFCGDALDFTKEIIIDSIRTDYTLPYFRAIEYFSHAEILFTKKLEDFPENFSVVIIAHTDSNEQKKLIYNFKIAVKKGSIKFLSDYM